MKYSLSLSISDTRSLAADSGSVKFIFITQREIYIYKVDVAIMSQLTRFCLLPSALARGFECEIYSQMVVRTW